MNKIIKFINNPYRIFLVLARKGRFNNMNDKRYLKLIYRAKMNKKLNLKNPKTFNEKLQWLKLYDRNPLYTTLVDKYEVKKYIVDKIGEKYIIPTIGVWDNFDDIDFDSLPNQFVLKCTHDSGTIVICTDKSNFDIESAKQKINSRMTFNYYYMWREWPYKDVKPRIIAEKYMEDTKTEELRDYKFFCFNGEVKALFVATDRQKSGEEVKFDFFDTNYNHLPIRQGHPNALIPPKKPECFEEMKELAKKLSENIPQVRVDFYEVDGKIYFGELTFSHFAGIVPFEPEEWDYKFGNYIKIDKE